MDRPYAKLCDFCKQVNFRAIFTPREWDPETERYSAINRPEYSGNGGTPLLREDWGKRKRKHAFGYDLPKIRTADYDDLSDSTDAEPEPTPDDRISGQIHDLNLAQHPDKANAQLAAELSDIEDDSDDQDGGDGDGGEAESEDDSVSTWSENSHFLDFHRVDIEKQAQGQWDYTHGLYYYMGTIWDLRKRRRECHLCWRLWRQTRKNPDVKNVHLTKSRCMLKLLELKGNKTDGSGKEVIMLNMIYLYAYKIGDPRSAEWIIKIPFVIQGAHRDVVNKTLQIPPPQVIPFEDRLYGEARLRSAECNYALFRAWLHLCETKHEHKTMPFVGDTSLRLIDVQKNCLTEWHAPMSEPPRFVALSYVWGEAQQKVMLTKSQVEAFKDPGFFSKHPLPQTIQDAIEVVRNMNERYLWVDSLCIIQDDNVDKAAQVPQMHQIYGQAVLTIVAAWGNNADAGLNGVGGRGRGRSGVFRLELEDMRVVFRGTTKLYWSPEPVDGDIGFRDNYLCGVTYKSRAWTYQEAFLSRRLLIFGKEQVYFECDRCTWCEESHWESDTIDFAGWRALKNPMPDDIWADNFDRQAYERQTGTLGEKPLAPLSTSFAAIVKEYSSRNLTYASDSLNACLGVLAAIAEREKSRFLFGLRTRFFGNDLLFNAADAVPRAAIDLSSSDRFPSWSWPAWEWTIEIPNEPRNNSHDLVENIVPCDGVKCYSLERGEDGTNVLQNINESGGWRFSSNYVKSGEGIYGPEDLHPAPRSSHRDDHDDSDSNVDDDESQPMAENDAVEESDEAPERAQEDENTANKDVNRHAELNIVLSVTNNQKFKRNKTKAEEIPEYSQDITLAEVQSHPAFSRITPNFHITFRTFSSLVLLRTEYDEWTIRLGSMVMAGTRKHRRDGIMGDNRDEVQRNLYVLKPKPKSDEPGSEHDHTPDNDDGEDNTCPCCGKDDRPSAAPDGFELGPYAGRLPPFSRSWNSRQYYADVPDGVYLLAYMNNNQLPMFGHLLLQPVTRPPQDTRYEWGGEIMERVCGALGPRDILLRSQQEKYAATWGTIVLG